MKADIVPHATVQLFWLHESLVLQMVGGEAKQGLKSYLLKKIVAYSLFKNSCILQIPCPFAKLGQTSIMLFSYKCLREVCKKIFSWVITFNKNIFFIHFY